MKFLCRRVVCVFVFEFVFIRYQSAALSESDRGWGKNVGLNTGVRLGEGWVGGSLLTLRCAEKLTHFYHGLKAPVCHTFDWSMFDYPIALKFRFWVLERFNMEVLWLSPLHQASHIWWMYWFEHQIEPKLMFTGLLSYRTDFCPFDITGRNLKVNHRLTCIILFFQTESWVNIEYKFWLDM